METFLKIAFGVAGAVLSLLPGGGAIATGATSIRHASNANPDNRSKDIPPRTSLGVFVSVRRNSKYAFLGSHKKKSKRGREVVTFNPLAGNVTK